MIWLGVGAEAAARLGGSTAHRTVAALVIERTTSATLELCCHRLVISNQL
jgi:hypothetical protein